MSHPAPSPRLLELEAEVRRLRELLERVRVGLVRVQARIGEAVREDEDLATWREVLG